MPSPRDSSSFHAAPMPSKARPPDSTSSVVMIFASIPGFRYVTPVTRVSNLARDVFAAR